MKHDQMATMRRGWALTSLALAGALFATGAPAKQSGTDWLWLSGTADAATCTWTVTVNWAGFTNAKTVEVFVTEGYTGSKLVPAYVQIRNKDHTATVTLPPLAASATSALFYPWAQLLDSHGIAIPASLDFSGQSLLYCAAP
jgi:hypothetical protein